MSKLLIVILFISHILGDFYLQNSKLAEKKDKKILGVVIHGLLYSLPFVLSFAVIEFSFRFLIAVVVICMLHFVIDSIKYTYYKLLRKRQGKGGQLSKEGVIFIIDQALHAVTIIVTSFLILNNSPDTWHWVRIIISKLPISIDAISQWCLLILLIAKPVNIAHGKLFSSFKPTKRDEIENEIKAVSKLHIAEIKSAKEKFKNTNNLEDVSDLLTERDKKAGALIGFMERLIIIIFLSLQQYAAIGLVLTAKSIVRYDRISKDQEFSEYYLIGTLYSFIAALLLYYVTVI